MTSEKSGVSGARKRKLPLKADLVSSGPIEGRGVVYVRHIPNGFFEPEMLEYFKQFGEVTRLRLSRSKKTGRSKGYAYVEFASQTVAQIAAKSMEDYLMFRQRLMCKYVEPADVHPETFKGANRPFSKPKAAVLARERHNRPQTGQKLAAGAERLRLRNEKKMAAFKGLGVEYELPGVMTKEEIRQKFAESTATTVVASTTNVSGRKRRATPDSKKKTDTKAAKLDSVDAVKNTATGESSKKRQAGENKNKKKAVKRLKVK